MALETTVKFFTMNNNAFNQGLYNAARTHYAGQPSIFATDAEMDAWIREQKKMTAVTPYQEPPPLEARYIAPITPRDQESELQPYTSDAEAWKDLGVGLAKGGAVAGGIAVIWGGVKMILAYFSALATAGAASIEAGLMANHGTVAAVGFGLLVAGILAVMGLGKDEQKRTQPGAIHQNQNIVVNTTVNVGGQQNARHG